MHQSLIQNPIMESLQEDGGTIFWALGDLKFSPTTGRGGGRSQMEGLRFSTLLGDNNKVFSTGGMEGVPTLLAKNYSSLPPGKVSPVDSHHQIFIAPTKGLFPRTPLNSSFLMKKFFQSSIMTSKRIDL